MVSGYSPLVPSVGFISIGSSIILLVIAYIAKKLVASVAK
jgi:hypothetical protein